MSQLQEMNKAYAQSWDLCEAAKAAVKNMTAASDSTIREQLRIELKSLDLKKLEAIDKIDTIYDRA